MSTKRRMSLVRGTNSKVGSSSKVTGTNLLLILMKFSSHGRSVLFESKLNVLRALIYICQVAHQAQGSEDAFLDETRH
jgi:hypothetical protein